MIGDVLRAAREQPDRQRAARRLLRAAAGKLEVTIGGVVRVTDPDLARELAALKPEVRELLDGTRCLVCGEPLAGMSRVPAEGVGWVHRGACAGYPRRPARR